MKKKPNRDQNKKRTQIKTNKTNKTNKTKTVN